MLLVQRRGPFHVELPGPQKLDGRRPVDGRRLVPQLAPAVDHVDELVQGLEDGNNELLRTRAECTLQKQQATAKERGARVSTRVSVDGRADRKTPVTIGATVTHLFLFLRKTAAPIPDVHFAFICFFFFF